MKNRIFFLVVVTFLNFGFSQEEISKSTSTFEINRQITLSYDSEISEIVFEVPEEAVSVNFNLSCQVLSGIVEIEIIDPRDINYGDFKVENLFDNSKKSKRSEEVLGSIEKLIENPKSGVWKIKLKPKNAKSHISIIARILS